MTNLVGGDAHRIYIIEIEIMDPTDTEKAVPAFTYKTSRINHFLCKKMTFPSQELALLLIIDSLSAISLGVRFLCIFYYLEYQTIIDDTFSRACIS